MLNKGMMSSSRYDWETPAKFFEDLDSKYRFTLDPCCTEGNRKCGKFFTQKENGLIKPWKGERVFVNPPYGREIYRWADKCWRQANCGADSAELVVGLFPARTDTRYFHDYVYHKSIIEFIKGRLRFELNGIPMGPAPFPSMLVIWGS